MKNKLMRLMALVFATVLVFSTLPETTVFAKTKSKKQTTIVVSTQEELDAALKNSSIKIITIKTDAKLSLTIKSGSYSNLSIVIDAPKASITNNASVKKMTVSDAKKLVEKASGNAIVINDDKLTVKVAKKADVSKLTLSKDDANISLTNNGTLTSLNVKGDMKLEVTQNGKMNKVTLYTPADVKIAGSTDSKTTVSVKAAAEGASIQSETPIKLNTAAAVDVKLEKGAEGSSIKVTSENVDINLTNDSNKKITVTEADGTKSTVKAGESTAPVADEANTTVEGDTNPESDSSSTEKEDDKASEENDNDKASETATSETESTGAEGTGAMGGGAAGGGSTGGGGSVPSTPSTPSTPVTPAPTERTESVEEDGYRYVKTYDANNNLIHSVRYKLGTNELVSTSDWTYNEDGSYTETYTQANGAVTVSTADSNGRLIREQQYYINQQQEYDRYYYYNEDGSSYYIGTSYEWDGAFLARYKAYITAENKTTRIEYLDPNTDAITYANIYEQGVLKSIVYYSSNEVIISIENYEHEVVKSIDYYNYDEDGKLEYVNTLSPSGVTISTTYYKYDSDDNLISISIKEAIGPIIAANYEISTYTPDMVLLKETTFNRDDIKQSEILYNPQEKTIQVIAYNQDGTIIADSTVGKTIYNEDGSYIENNPYINGDGLVFIETIAYNSIGKKIHSESYCYNNNKKSNAHDFEYHENGEMSKSSWVTYSYTTPQSIDEEVLMTYDENGNTTWQKNTWYKNNGSVETCEWTYEDGHMKTAVTILDNVIISETNYEYLGEVGRYKVTSIYADGRKTVSESILINYEMRTKNATYYDSDNNITSEEEYEYNENGTGIMTVTYPDGRKDIITIDTTDYPLHCDSYDAEGNLINSYDYN